MKVTSLVMVIIGVVLGIMMGLVAMAVGGIGNAVEEGSGNTAVGLGMSAIAACVFAMTCSGFHFGGKKPTLMAAGLTIALAWHVVSISYFAIPGGIFLAMGTLFAWFSRGSRQPETASTGIAREPAA